ncbi:MAG: rhomboid family intramembrane serine protease [Bacteroidales bacterium]|nr:rhomboid family intramembrane serine protease [Bacteroidales bacterium]
MQRNATVTKNIIVINVIIFIATLLNENFMVGTFALFYPALPYFRWWQIVTHMFMHGGFWHIFFNMYTLYMFGSVVENIIGPRKFLIYYFVCGLGAAGLHLGVEAVQVSFFAASLPPVVGASGAIYGVLIAFAMLFPESRLTLLFPPVSMKARTMVIVFAAIELFTGVTGFADGIAHFAHLGGMLFGWLLIRFWKAQGTLFNRE